MKDFTMYQTQKDYARQTIRINNYHLQYFKMWCTANKQDIKNITYQAVLSFIRHEKARNITEISITNRLNAIRIYYDYLEETGQVKQNIIRQVKMRHPVKKVKPEPLTPVQLENIYKEYANQPGWQFRSKKEKQLHKRNKVALGLMIFQGVVAGELARLETYHVNLDEGKIYIPSTRKSNARLLQLHANQIIPLQAYMSEIEKGYLFPCKKFTDLVSRITRDVKKISPALESSRHIRSSVIMNWLQQYNIRQVQYMAGHKKIKSTEHYKNEDLSDLTKQLELFHPLK
jgi:site-specific recombinase XerD